MLACCLLSLGLGLPVEDEPFRIDCVDAATGRGVPLVSLQAVDGMRWISDSAGVVAIREPDLVGEKTWFHVESSGYEHAADGFGNRGRAFVIQPGGRGRIELTRTQIAERLFRTTGRGIYRDLELCGGTAPVPGLGLNARVTGLDSVQCIPDEGGLFWLFGDTSRPAYPLGHFFTAGARSRRPGSGGLDPDLGLELDFYVDETGFSRGLCKPEGPGAMWVDGLCAVPGEEGPRLFAHFVRVRDLGHSYEAGILEWNRQTEFFERRAVVDPSDTRMLHGHLVGRRDDDGQLWFGNPFPSVRVAANAEAVSDPEAYECWSCLSEDEGEPRILRDEHGVPRWRWCRASPLGLREMFHRHQELGLGEDDAWVRPVDVETGRGLALHAGNVQWNEHRACYVCIANEQGGEHSNLGDVWYLEADTPMGPWVFARRIAWHEGYSYYNPFQHPWFARDQGRILYFEGTYSRTFSRTQLPTPLYDYNQLRYRLDTDDPRLALPRPVYRVREANGAEVLCTGAEVRDRGLEDQVVDLAFCLLPPDRALPGTHALRAAGRDTLLGHAPGPLPAEPPPHLVPLDQHPELRAMLDSPPDGVGLWRPSIPTAILLQVLKAED